MAEQPQQQQPVSSTRRYKLAATATNIRAGVAWDFFKGSAKVDLDMSAMIFDELSYEHDVAFYNKLSACDGAVQHSGDNRDGQASGDDESISINLSQLNESVRSLFFLVNVHDDKPNVTFKNVETGRFTLYVNDQPCYTYHLSL